MAGGMERMRGLVKAANAKREQERKEKLKATEAKHEACMEFFAKHFKTTRDRVAGMIRDVSKVKLAQLYVQFEEGYKP
jgi:hypothetical protein